MRIAVLGSTRGTSLQAIIDAGIPIELVISNKEQAYILERARLAGLKSIFLDSRGLKREEYDLQLMKILGEHRVDLVVLIGYMRILSKNFVDEWKGKVVNIHPSLLPAFAGGMDLNIHKAVLERGCKITGATLMYIDDGADTGPIIAQRPVSVFESDTPEILKERVQKVEGEMLVDFLKEATLLASAQ